MDRITEIIEQLRARRDQIDEAIATLTAVGVVPPVRGEGGEQLPIKSLVRAVSEAPVKKRQFWQQTPEGRARISASMRKHWAASRRGKLSKANRRTDLLSPEARARQAQSMKAYWARRKGQS